MSTLLENVALFAISVLVFAFIAMLAFGFALLAIVLGICGYYFSSIICLVIQLAIWSSKNNEN